ncbi:hypothetical protein GCM10009554_10660 [Kribbella koreensis]|uniref:Nuclear transport factor 2 family protein n=1 Tax=Kribbella koreensis TaxID=57909 RepID=A0ABP3ZYF7_9ACTN
MSTTTMQPDVTTAVAKLIRFLETGEVPDGLFTPDVFTDLSLPQWRVQANTVDDVLAIRLEGHPSPGKVHVTRVDPTDRGFTIEFEERWEKDGQRWYCREMLRADVVGAAISDLSVYCTGDWDEAKQREHAAAVRLIRP